MAFAEWILSLATLPVVLATVFAAIRYKKLNQDLKYFSWFIFFSCIIQLSSFVLWLFKRNNMPLLHVYVAIGFVLLAFFYHVALKHFLHRAVIPIAGLLFFLYSLFNTVFIEHILTFNATALAVESVLIIILSLSAFIFFLSPALKAESVVNTSGINWINSGLFIYYASNLLFFYFGGIIMKELPISLSRNAWLIHAFFSTVMYICFIIGLWKQPKA